MKAPELSGAMAATASYGRVITGRTRVVGVMGHPIGHSLSPLMHNAAFAALDLDYCYVAFDVASEQVEAAVRGMAALGIVGLNVTIPHKPAAFGLAEELAPSALRVGAVNTLHLQENRLVGHNTDGEGFARSLELAGVDVGGKRVVILGAGGAAVSVACACLDRGAAAITVLNRTLCHAEKLVKRLREIEKAETGREISLSMGTLDGEKSSITSANIVVHCTPLGMYPHLDDPLPAPAEWMRPGQVVYDLIYNPEETRFLQAARAAGAQTLNGVEMLVCQGAVAFEIWTGVAPPIDVMRDALLRGLRLT